MNILKKDMAFKQDLDAILNCNNIDSNQFLIKINTFVNKIELGLNDWLNEQEWNKEILLNKNNNDNKNTCPYNKAHTRISDKNLNKHIEKCRLKSLEFSNLNIVICYILTYFFINNHFIFKRKIILNNQTMIHLFKLK
jgi:hypothetical protein